MPRLQTALPLLAFAVFLTACQSTPTGIPSSQELPRIDSSGTRGGKGIPNGRTDSSAPFMNEGLERSVDPTYAYTKENPVKVGPRTRARFDVMYLNALRGPNGEPIEYERKGACCMFETKNSEFGGGMLDIYTLRIAGNPKEFYIFVNMYDPGPPKVPAGLSQRK